MGNMWSVVSGEEGTVWAAGCQSAMRVLGSCVQEVFAHCFALCFFVGDFSEIIDQSAFYINL